MNCIKFEAAIDRAIQAREALDSAAIEHAATCAGCQSALNRHRLLETVIHTWRLVTPPATLIDAVMAELALPAFEENPEDLADLIAAEDFSDDFSAVQAVPQLMPALATNDRIVRNHPRSGVLAMASMAACLFVAVYATISLKNVTSRPTDDLVQTVPSLGLTSEQTDTSINVSDTLVEVFADIRSEYRGIANETRTAAREIVNSIPQHVVSPTVVETDDFEILPDASDVERMWNPIGSRVGSALGFLWQTLPSEIPAG